MTTTITSDKNKDIIIGKEETVWVPKNNRSWKKFVKWCFKNCLKPGDLIPEKIFKKYWKKEV